MRFAIVAVLIFFREERGVEFTDLQKPEPVGAIINKGGLQTRFNPDYGRLVNITP